MQRKLIGLGGLIVLVAGSGCFNSGVYRTARTLEAGEGDLGFSVALTKLSQTTTTVESSETETSELTLPTIVPEINYHLGITDDFEFGGRVAPSSLFVELDGKYRFVGAPGEKLHVAVGLHLGYQTALIMDGPSIGVPLIATYDVTDNLALNVAGFARFLFLDESFDSDDFDIGFVGNTRTLGGHFGVELRGETFYIMPAFEVSKWTAETETTSDGTTTTTEFDTTVLQGMVTFGFVFGREKKQLDRMEDKLDRMQDKLDKALDK